MGNYQAYEKYKDYGVEWLGEIPEHWEVLRVKHLTKILRGKFSHRPRNDPKLYDGEYAFIQTGDVANANKFIIEYSQTLNEEGYTVSKEFPSGTLVMTIAANIGDMAILNFNACFPDSIVGFLPSNKTSILFLYYLFTSMRKQFLSTAVLNTQLNLNVERIRNLFTVIAPLDEQEQIANFLDHKTKQIDDLIAKKEALLAKLDEKRSAIISHAVTKGLDPNVPMKDSGIEWLGEIPEHWQAKKLKFVSSITRGAILRPVDEPSYFDENGEWYYLNISDVTKCERFLYSAELKLSELGSNRSARVLPDNLILTASATIGKPIINKVKACIHDGFIAFKDISINIIYLFYFFLDPSIYAAMGKTNTQKNIYLDEVKNVVIGIPSLDEQTKIVQYLDKKTADIDLQKAKVQEAIERLKEYRTALITNAVTGKIDVRQVSLN